MGREREAAGSGRRPLVLALSALAPVALVALWLAWSGSDEPRLPPSPPSGAVSERAVPGSGAPRPPTSARAGERSTGPDLASLVERQQALLRQREADEARGADEDGYEDAWGESGERALGRSDGRDGPTPEQVRELQRETEEEMPSEEELTALMLDEPPMPSPAEIEVLRQRTAALLEVPPDEVERLRAESEAKQPSAERLEVLKARLKIEQEKRRQGIP